MMLQTELNNENNSFCLMSDSLKAETEKADSNQILQARSPLKFVGTLAVATACAFAATPVTTDTYANDIPYMRHIETKKEADKPFFEKMNEVLDRYEEVVFRYPAFVLSIDKEKENNDSYVVSINVSVDGKDRVVKRSLNSFNFELVQNMDLRAQGIIRRGVKKLEFTPAEDAEFTKDQLEIIHNL